MSPAINPVVLFFASIFTSNILLVNFLGMCSFISISKDFDSSNGLGMAVTFVMTVTAAINWLVYKYLIIPYDIEYLKYIIFIMVIAAVVQILEMMIDRYAPALYIKLGIFLPLVTVNCAILGAILFMQLRNYTFIQAIFFSAGSGIGWWLAILLLAAIRKKTENCPAPAALKGTGLALIIIGIMAMGFIGFAGMLNVQ